MANIYVDLDPAAVSGAGTSVSPYNQADFVGVANTFVGNAYMRNSGSLPAGTIGNASLNMLCWDKSVDANGIDAPWGIGAFNVAINLIAGTIEGGRFSLGGLRNNASLTCANLINCQASTAGAFGGVGGFSVSTAIKGCTIIGQAMTSPNPSQGITDSIIGLVAVGWSGFTATNCAIGALSTSMTLVNCQLGYNYPSVYPAGYDGSQASLDSTLWFATMTSSVSIGAPPYTGYNKGLWRTARAGIGALDFIVPKPKSLSYFAQATVEDGSPVVSIASPAAILARVALNNPETTFTDISQVAKISITYRNVNDKGKMNQNKTIDHRFDGTNFVGMATWNNGAKDGAWIKTQVKVNDPNNGSDFINRDIIGFKEDISHSGTTMTLNIA